MTISPNITPSQNNCGVYYLHNFPYYWNGDPNTRLADWQDWLANKFPNYPCVKNYNGLLPWNGYGGKFYQLGISEYQWSKEIHELLLKHGWQHIVSFNNAFGGTKVHMYCWTDPKARLEV